MYRYTYDEIANKYIDTIYRLALSRTNSHQYAEDITQEVFLKLMSNRKQFESEEHLKAWLLRVTTSELDENLSYTHEEESDLYYALAKLSQKYRTVIHLHYYEGYQIDEIAKITNASVGTVKSQLHRGRQMLKSILEGDESIG